MSSFRVVCLLLKTIQTPQAYQQTIATAALIINIISSKLTQNLSLCLEFAT